MNTERIKALVTLGLPLSAKEEAEYLLLIANESEFKKYMEVKHGNQ